MFNSVVSLYNKINMHTIYIYIEREREREIKKKKKTRKNIGINYYNF
jgi:hypothetical protein